MPHKKRASRRGNYNFRLRGRGDRHKPFVPVVRSSSKNSSDGLALQDEAFNTSENRGRCNSDKGLRYARIAFVTTGTMAIYEPKNSLQSPQNLNTNFAAQSDYSEDSSCVNLAKNTNLLIQEQVPLVTYHFDSTVKDFNNNEPSESGLPLPRVRSTSLTSSNSSEEVIVFKGRNNSEPPLVTNLEENDPLTEKQSRRQVEVVENEKQEQINSTEKNCQQVSRFCKINPSLSSVNGISSKLKDAQLGSYHNSNAPSLKHSKAQTPKDVTNDYLANIDSQDDLAMLSFSKQDLGGTSDPQSDESLTDSSIEIDLFDQMWDSTKREYPKDYIISNNSAGKSENRLLQTNLNSESKYVRQQNQNSSKVTNSSTTPSTENPFLSNVQKSKTKYSDKPRHDASDFDNQDSDSHAENEELSLCLNIKNNITSKKVKTANKFFRQHEQLGTNYEDRTSKNNMELIYSTQSISTFPSPSKKSKKKCKKKNKKKEKTKGKGKKSLDDYCYSIPDVFDIMKLDHPSFKKSKHTKNSITFEFPDPKMGEYMKMALQNNRFKKKERLKERENLRSLGLLGNKNGKPDLQHKYKDGMSFHEFKEELKTFLIGNNSTLVLPTMDKFDRKIVHEIASLLKLKSKSNGVGLMRHPVLYRTSRTSHFVEETFQYFESEYKQGISPGVEFNGKKTFNRKKIRNSKINKLKIGYQDGEIVGGSAPEISADNKGRAMLEKMGWSTGTALGALNNKGILQPLPHIVKKSKAGLR